MILSEIRFAARRLRRAPSFAAAVVLVLALGVGGATAVFSLVDGILLEPLPYPESDRLVRLSHSAASAAGRLIDQSDALLMLYQAEANAFDGVAAWRFDDGDLRGIEEGQGASRVRGARVTANFFDVLGVPPARGRTFRSGEDRPGRNGVVVLSHRAWQQRLHGDASAIGRQIVVNEVPRTVVGVMPEGFAYPTDQTELWLPLALDAANPHPATFNLVGLGRLKRGVSSEAARADLARVLSTAAGQQGNVVPRVESLYEAVVGPFRRFLWPLLGSAVLVLLAACTNVIGLFLVRGSRARRELAVRSALGSGTMGLAARPLSEAALLSAAGGALGVLLATLGVEAVARGGAPFSLPRLDNVRVDLRVLAFALVVSILCALSVSVLPLLRSRVSATEALRGATGVAGGRADHRVRDALVVAQIALALVLVASSVLMARSFVRLSRVPPGFDADRVVVSRLLLPFASYGSTASRLDFFQAVVRGAETIPGVREVALTDWVPLSGDHHDAAIELEDASSGTDGPESNHAVARVDGGYFETLRIPLLRGRTFADLDAAATDAVIVSHAFAERYWPGQDPIGRRLRPLGGGGWYAIVGEVGDVHYEGLAQPADEIVYFSVVPAPAEGTEASVPGALALVLRADAPSGDVLPAIRGVVQSLDPSVPTYDQGSLPALVEAASARTRALAGVLGIASVVTSLLGLVGLYGNVAYGISIRRRELGIRLALGAGNGELCRMVSLEGVRIAGIGIAIGTGLTLATSRTLRALLFGVSPTDPATLGATALLLLALAFLASWIPARRAARIQPAEVLRSE